MFIIDRTTLLIGCSSVTNKRETMKIPDEIEKLINERGSSTILKDYLLPLRDPRAVLTKKKTMCGENMTSIDTQISTLKNEMLNLQEINKQLEFENSKLMNQINRFRSSIPNE